MKRVVILDISAMIYRAHFALMNMKNSKGISTGATYGFVNTIEGILKELKPDYMVACLDVKRSELKRSEELDSYKAHRESMPQELVDQIEYIMEIIDGYKIPKYKVIGYEADDIISTFAQKFSDDIEEDFEIYVVTGDKDLSQLVNGKINIALLGKGDGKSLFKYIRTNEDVVEYLGVTPDKIPDLFGLMGDSSDGIPGVPGVGPKTGVKFINQYGSLENLYENIEDIKGKVKEKLIDNKENAFLSRKLATVYRNVDVEYNKEKLKIKEKDFNKLLEIYKILEFKRFASDMEKIIKSQGNIFEKYDSQTEVSLHITNLENISFENLLEKVENIEEKEIAIYENEFGISLSFKNKSIVSLFENNNKYDLKKLFEKLKSKEIIGYNLKELLKKGFYIDKYFDIMIAWYVLGTESSQDLENIVFSIFGESIEKYEEQFKKMKLEDISEEQKIKFLYKRSSYLFNLKGILENKLIEENLYNIYDNLESKLIPVLANMEKNGIKININYFTDYKKQLELKIYNVEEKIYSIVGEKFNISSTKQLSKILFEDMGIEPIKKTKTGYSTDVEVLELLAERGIEIAERLLEYRAYTKLLSTYVDPLPKLADEFERIHTTFNQNGTATGRLSSTNPNLQNIPTRTEEGTKIRNGFVAEQGWSLLSFDYSQIELRVLAELSRDENLILAYQQDKDLHDLTARKIFYKLEKEDVTKFERSIAKVINFSILYGKTPFGLSKELKIPLQDASQYIKTYFKQYPKVKEFLENTLEEARLKGFVETMYGTRRYISNINSSNKNLKSQGERMAVNTVVQGTAANIIKMVMIELYNTFKSRDDIKLLLQVHDELIFEVKDEKINEYMEQIEKIMENTIVFKTLKLKANGSCAKNWGDLK